MHCPEVLEKDRATQLLLQRVATMTRLDYCCESLPVPDLQAKLYHRHACVGRTACEGLASARFSTVQASGTPGAPRPKPPTACWCGLRRKPVGDAFCTCRSTPFVLGKIEGLPSGSYTAWHSDQRGEEPHHPVLVPPRYPASAL